VKDQQKARTVGDVLDGSIRGSGKFAFSSVTGHEVDESNIGSIIDHNEDEDKDVDATIPTYDAREYWLCFVDLRLGPLATKWESIVRTIEQRSNCK
jgi:hypothetical protein